MIPTELLQPAVTIDWPAKFHNNTKLKIDHNWNNGKRTETENRKYKAGFLTNLQLITETRKLITESLTESQRIQQPSSQFPTYQKAE